MICTRKNQNIIYIYNDNYNIKRIRIFGVALNLFYIEKRLICIISSTLMERHIVHN